MTDKVTGPDGSALSEGLGPLREAADAVMAHQWSNNRQAMDALTRLVDAASAAEPRETLRDYFAAKALPGVLYMVAHGVHDAASSAEGCALAAYKLADAMLAVRAA